MSITVSSCRICERLAAAESSLQPYVYFDGQWCVTPATRFHDVPGWTYVALRRHVESLDQLSKDEAQEMAGVLARTSRLIERLTGAERVYLMAFGEVMPHVHFLLTPRLPELALEHRGARIWDHAECLANADGAAEFNRKMLTALREDARSAENLD